MGLDIFGTSFASVSIGKLQGSKGTGMYRVLVRLDFSIHAWTPSNEPTGHKIPWPALVGLSGNLALMQGTPIARLQPVQPIAFVPARPKAWHFQTELSADLTQAQIAEVERLRRGGDISFKLDLNASLTWNGDHHFGWEQYVIHMNQSEWNQLLSQWNYSKKLLVELPTPPETDNSKLGQALKFFHEAHGEFIRGNWRRTISACRESIEALNEGVDTIENRELQMIDLLKEKRRRTKAERFLLIEKALLHYCDPAHHADKTAANFEWDREDAQSILSMVSGLINVAANGYLAQS